MFKPERMRNGTKKKVFKTKDLDFNTIEKNLDNIITYAVHPMWYTNKFIPGFFPK